jgi:hypothetical protein
MTRKKPKNLKLLEKHLLKYIVLILILFIVISLFLKKYDFILSALVGVIFSFLIFSNMQATQMSIVRNRNIKPFFPQFIIRIFLYAAPIVLALKEKPYFNLPVILVSLFVFQAGYIFTEFFRGLKKYKRRYR